jgi:hypothetical protein
VLVEEEEEQTFSSGLVFYYYEIARLIGIGQTEWALLQGTFIIIGC